VLLQEFLSEVLGNTVGLLSAEGVESPTEFLALIFTISVESGSGKLLTTSIDSVKDNR